MNITIEDTLVNILNTLPQLLKEIPGVKVTRLTITDKYPSHTQWHMYCDQEYLSDIPPFLYGHYTDWINRTYSGAHTLLSVKLLAWCQKEATKEKDKETSVAKADLLKIPMDSLLQITYNLASSTITGTLISRTEFNTGCPIITLSNTKGVWPLLLDRITSITLLNKE